MPSKISIVRHAQGFHNSTRDYDLPDPLLTPLGKEQCAEVSATYPNHDTINLVLASPLRRTIQTAAYSFGPALAREDVPFICLPSLQEVSETGADTGTDRGQIERVVSEMFESEALGFDAAKIDFSRVEEGWNSNQGFYAYTRDALIKRAAYVRNHVFALAATYAHIVLVTHGAIAHFITEDWTDVADPMTETAYRNCEVREFQFTEASTGEDAHLEELEESKKKRTSGEKEDKHVVAELKGVEG